MSEVVIIKPKVLLGVAALSAVLSTVANWWFVLARLVRGCVIDPFEGISGMIMGTPYLLLVLLWPFVLFIPAIRKRISTQTLTYLYVIGWCVLSYSTADLSMWWIVRYLGCSKATSATPIAWNDFIPSFVAVPTSVADAILGGGIHPIPWGVWIPVMIWLFLYLILFAMMSIAVSNIFRREWMDVEKVTFPQAMLAYETLAQVHGGEAASPRKRNFLIGMLIGIVLGLPIAMQAVFPWFPDIYGWRTATCGNGAQQLPSGSFLYSLPIAIHMFTRQPLVYALAYALPLSVTFSVWFFTLIYVILVYLAYSFGYYTALTTTGSCGRLWCGELSPLIGPPLLLRAVSAGGMFAFGIMTLFSQRRYLVMTLKAALGRVSRDEVQTIEKDEPTSYRNSWAMLAVAFIFMVALLVVTGFSFAMAFLLIFMSVLLWLWQTRVFGLTGAYIEHVGAALWVPRILYFPVTPTNLSTDYVLGGYMWVAPSGRHPGDGWGASMLTGFHSYKMASLTGTNTKSIFSVMVVSLIVSAFVAILNVVWGANTYGFGPLFGTSSYWDCSMEFWATTFMQEPGAGPPSQWAPQFVFGMVLVGIMSILHARFVWFPSPIGPIFTFTYLNLLWGWWGAFLVGWILKTLTLRIGGSKLYEQRGLPMVAGIIAAYVAIGFVFGLAGIIRMILGI
jgi:hypothetical protein